MSDPAARWLARTASDFRADGVTPLTAVANLALHGRTAVELPQWCDIVDHLAGGAATELDPPPGVAVCDLVGPLYELMLADVARRSAGAHFTRPALAAGLVVLAADGRQRDVSVEDTGEGSAAVGTGEVALDPSCGAGAFLLAVARHLIAERSARSVSSPTVGEVLTRLVGADLDANALVVARVALARWALDEGGGGDASDLDRCEPALVSCDALTEPDVVAAATGGRPVALVVGNPPFLAQLRAGTRHDADRRAALAERFGAAVGPYTDTAALFLLGATELVTDGGAVCLIQPRSVLAARDATAVRTELLRRTAMRSAWVGDGGFDASVEVWAPVFASGAATTEVRVVGGSEAQSDAGTVPRDRLTPGSWGALVAAAEGLPVLGRSRSGRSPGRLGEVAGFSAGFRDEYYAMLALAEEAALPNGTAPEGTGPGCHVPSGYAALVSSGLIDPGVCRWGRRAMRFGKRSWQAPVVSLAALQTAGDRSAAWAERQLVPKVLIASQTRVIEAAPDLDGRAIGLTPVIAGLPDRIGLAHLLAVLCSPVSTLAVVSAMAGSGLGRAGVRVSTTVLADLELPAHQGPWDEAAGLLADQCSLDVGIDRSTMHVVTDLMVAAGGVDDPDGVRSWYLARESDPRGTNGAERNAGGARQR